MTDYSPDAAGVLHLPLTDEQVETLHLEEGSEAVWIGGIAKGTFPNGGQYFAHVFPTSYALANKASRVARGLPATEPRKKKAAKKQVPAVMTP